MAAVLSKKIKVNDVFIQDAESGLLESKSCYLVKEILSVSEFGSVNLVVVDLCSYSELKDISQEDILNGSVGGNEECMIIFVERVIILGNVTPGGRKLQKILKKRSNKDIVMIDGIELDFTVDTEDKEVKKMEDLLISAIVDYPSAAKEFINAYRESDSMDAVASMYGITEDQVDDIVGKIKLKYGVHNAAESYR